MGPDHDLIKLADHGADERAHFIVDREGQVLGDDRNLIDYDVFIGDILNSQIDLIFPSGGRARGTPDVKTEDRTVAVQPVKDDEGRRPDSQHCADKFYPFKKSFHRSPSHPVRTYRFFFGGGGRLTPTCLRDLVFFAAGVAVRVFLFLFFIPSASEFCDAKKLSSERAPPDVAPSAKIARPERQCSGAICVATTRHVAGTSGPQ